MESYSYIETSGHESEDYTLNFLAKAFHWFEAGLSALAGLFAIGRYLEYVPIYQRRIPEISQNNHAEEEIELSAVTVET